MVSNNSVATFSQNGWVENKKVYRRMTHLAIKKVKRGFLKLNKIWSLDIL